MMWAVMHDGQWDDFEIQRIDVEAISAKEAIKKAGVSESSVWHVIPLMEEPNNDQ